MCAKSALRMSTISVGRGEVSARAWVAREKRGDGMGEVGL